jgi:hypothetical protein
VAHIEIVTLLGIDETTGFIFVLLGIATERTPEVV